MENRIFTVAIIGVGARGGDTYGPLIHAQKDKFKIVALCDLKKDRLDRFGKEFDVPENARFQLEDEFFKEKRADLLLVATQDQDHVGHCVKGFALGYDIMTEKPLTDKKEDCEALLAAQQKSGTKALVCHVLRYAPAFIKVKQLLDEGVIGRLVAIDALERVGSWHQAHSYVRGNWRRSDQATPMILAKCCHDLDLLQYYAKSKCKSVSSVGDCTFFNAQNAPAGAAKRCVDCSVEKDCPYSAKHIYLTLWKKRECPVDIWPFNVIAPAPLTEEKLVKAVQEGPYGRCVFACDNDVVDHQQTMMTFENGVKATLTMTGFTYGGGRRMSFYGTMGQITFDEQEEKITIGRYEKDPEYIDISELTEKGYAHGGGDQGLINSLYDMLCGNTTEVTSFEASVESHLIGICAEESRLKGGELIYVHK